MKNKLSKKAKAYLKAQGGLQVPYEFPYQDNTTPFDLGQIDPNLQSAQQNQMMGFNPNPNSIQFAQPQQNQNSNVLDKLGSLGSIGSTIKIGTGVLSLFQAAKERKKARRRESNAEKDLARRMKESRENDFYYTGQTSGSYSDFNKSGGKIPYQNGGFTDFYNQMQNQNKLTQNNWNNYYNQYIEQQKEKARTLQQQGWSDIVGSVTDQLNQAASVLSGGMMKKGGILSKVIEYQTGGIQSESTGINMPDPTRLDWYRPITKTAAQIDAERDSLRFEFKKQNPALFDVMMGKNPENMARKRKITYRDRFHEKQEGGIINENLYSPDFQSPAQQDAGSFFQETMNKYQALDPQGAFENKAMSWIFEEEENPNYPMDSYLAFQNSNKSVIEQIKFNESGGNYSAVNPITKTTGAYQFNPRYWGTQIRDFMGMNNTPVNQVMEEFKNNPQAQDMFMKHIVENVYMPEVKKLKPLAKEYGFSDNDLIKLIHYRGIGDARKRLETGNFEVSKEEKQKYKNPDIISYLRK